MSGPISGEPACKGSQVLSAHQMEPIGNCSHHPKGSIRDYEVSRCGACGVTAHRARMFACGRGIKEVKATPETCAALRGES